VLSLQLPFAVIPLILFASDRGRMGRLAIGPIMKAVAWPCAVLITLLNVWLLWTTVIAWF
jgi:manganese transport protein